MCGITAIMGLDEERENRKNEIERMSSMLAHRGPDGWGTYISENIALGHTRLSIIDMTSGNQPMMTDKSVIAYNGEVYNYLEIRNELVKKGVCFNTKSDTEVVLKAFEYYGNDAFKKFNGQFAFIIWNKIEKKMVIARDRYGIRPLYILKYRNRYYFSSEMKAFDVLEGYNRTFNIQNLYEHALLWNSIDDNTVFNDIRILPAGTFEIYKDGESPLNFRYYEIGESNSGSPVDFMEAKDEFEALLQDSVKLRLRSDVPVACYLSGGIDSSVITHLTAEIMGERFKTFSVAFDDKDYDESEYQRELVNYINSDHYELKIDYDLINNNFMDAVYHTERPIFRTAPIPLFLLAKAVNNSDIKVVLTGEAADEILYGYDSFKELMLLALWRKEPLSKEIDIVLKNLYPHLSHFSDSKQFKFIKMYYEGFVNDYDNELAGLNIRTTNNKIITNYLNRDHGVKYDKDKLVDKIRKILPNNFHSWTILQKNQFLEMKSLLSGYLLSSQGDRMSLAHSVEGRYPFLDHRIVEKVFYYKDSFKLNKLFQKYLLKETFKEKIPTSIINRPKLPYQAPDLKSFFRNGKPTDNAGYFLSNKIISDYGIFDEKIVSRLLNKFKIRTLDQIGYRDNMVITFILSTQIVKYWINNPQIISLDNKIKKVEIVDYPENSISNSNLKRNV